MNANDRIRAALIEEIGAIAPEADLEALGGGEPLREALDLDSMDFLQLVRAIATRYGVEVPESEYRELDTLDHAVEYLAARVGSYPAEGA